MLSLKPTSSPQVDLKVREYRSGSTHTVLAVQRFSLETSGDLIAPPTSQTKESGGRQRGRKREKENKLEKEPFLWLSTTCLVHPLSAPQHILDDSVNGYMHGLQGQLPLDFLGRPRSHLDHIQQLRETLWHRSSSTTTLHSTVVAGSFRRSGNRQLCGHHWSPQQLEAHPHWPQLILPRCILLQLHTWSEDNFGWEITKILGKSEDRGGFDQCAHG